jgi:hypothetical protein
MSDTGRRRLHYSYDMNHTAEKVKIRHDIAEESVRIGESVANQLSDQHGHRFVSHLFIISQVFLDKQLSAADSIATTEHALQRSMRVLRGMTWSGMLYNFVTKEPIAQKDLVSDHQKPLEKTYDRNQYQREREILFAGGAPSSLGSDEEDIIKLSGTLDQLEKISVTINKSLQSQTELADDLNEKTAQVNDIALATMLRTAQLTHRAKNSIEVEIGVYFFLHRLSGQYLSVNGSTLTLSRSLNRAALFRIFSKECHILGMQSLRTFRYVGINLWGGVVVSSTSFGSYEEVFIDLDHCKEALGILFLAANWGGGGWLQSPVKVNSDPWTEAQEAGRGCNELRSVSAEIADYRNRIQMIPQLMGSDEVNRVVRLEE